MSSSPVPHELDGPSAAGLRLPASTDRIATKIAQIGSITGPEDACALLKEIAHDLGCESSAFATFLQDDPWHQTYRFLLACHPSWCAQYQKLAWFADDPWLLYARANVRPALAAEIPCHTVKQEGILALARRFDVRAALIVPAPASAGLTRLGVLMLGSPDDLHFDSPEFPKLKVLARSLSSEFLDWYTSYLREEFRRASKMTDLDIELLKFERLGVSSKEIFRLTGVSSKSVDSRFQRIIGRLKVGSRRAAAQLAAEYGLL